MGLFQNQRPVRDEIFAAIPAPDFMFISLKSSNFANLTRPDGGIGRRAGLKIQWPFWLCGFKSRSGYQTGQEVIFDLLSCFQELGN